MIGHHHLKNNSKYIVQQYINNPLLIGGKKFDLRLYVLVTSYNPLTVYMYREGFCRFSTVRFNVEKGSLSNNVMHLTNVAVQKHSHDYDSDTGGKWHVRQLKLYLLRKYDKNKVNLLFKEIEQVVIKSLLSVEKIMINDQNSFAVYGYDIMIDHDLKVWLIEINACPSLTASNPDDLQLKLSLLKDSISILNIDGKFIGDEEEIGGYNLIYKNQYINFHKNCQNQSFLACTNKNREYNIKKLLKISKERFKQKKKNESTKYINKIWKN